MGKPVGHDIYHEITITLQSKAKEKRSSIPNKPNVANKIKKKKINVKKKDKKKDRYQSGLMFYTRDLGHETNITASKRLWRVISN